MRSGKEWAAVTVQSRVEGKEDEIGHPPRQKQKREERVDTAADDASLGRLVVTETSCRTGAHLEDAQQQAEDYLRHGKLVALDVEVGRSKVYEEDAQAECSCTAEHALLAQSRLLVEAIALVQSAAVGLVEVDKAGDVLSERVLATIAHARAVLAEAGCAVSGKPLPAFALHAHSGVLVQVRPRNPQTRHQGHSHRQPPHHHGWGWAGSDEREREGHVDSLTVGVRALSPRAL